MYTGEAVKFDDNRLDFNHTSTVVVKKDLYAFKPGYPVEAYKIINFASILPLRRIEKITLPTFQREGRLKDFSVCNWAGNIILTGGTCSTGTHPYKHTQQTYLLNLKTDKWYDESFLPDLKQNRAKHGSISLGEQTFVACGLGAWSDRYLRSVEVLRLAAKAWEYIEVPEDLTVRVHPILCPINDGNICILGGSNNKRYVWMED